MRGSLGDARAYNEALMLLLEGDPDGSERVLRAMRGSSGRVLASAMHLLGWHVMRRGNLLEGMILREAGRLIGVFGANRPPPLPLWDGSPLAGRTIAVDLEGGWGDQIHWSRFVKNLLEAGASKVTLFADGGLIALLRNSFPESVQVEDRRFLLKHRFSDLWVRSMSLVRLLALEWSDLDGAPWIAPDPDRVATWKRKLSSEPPGPRVALRWTGSEEYAHERERRFDPAILRRELLGALGFSVYPDWLAPEKVPAWAPFPGLDGTWSDTAAFLSRMDLVVSSETCVAVLAAAMGIPTIILAPTLTGYFMWPWQSDPDSHPAASTPWYNSALIRRLLPDKTSSVLSLERDIREALVSAAHRPEHAQ